MIQGRFYLENSDSSQFFELFGLYQSMIYYSDQKIAVILVALKSLFSMALLEQGGSKYQENNIQKDLYLR